MIRLGKSWLMCLTIGLATLGNAIAETPADSFFLFGSRAYPDQYRSVGINPAELGVLPGMHLGLYSRFPADQSVRFNPFLIEKDTYWGLMLPGLGVSYEWLNTGDTAQRFLTVGVGGEVVGGLSAGFAGRLPAGEWARTEAIAGILWRPHSAVSLAGVYQADAHDNWSLHPGVGLRPLAIRQGSDQYGHRLTVHADASYSDAGAVGDWYGITQVAVEAEVLPGLALSGSYNHEGSWSIGLGFAAGFSRSDTSVLFNSDRELQTGMVAAGFSTSQYQLPPAQKSSRLIEYSGLQLIGELPAYQRIGGFAFSDGSRPFAEFVDEIDLLAMDPSVAGILFTNPVFSGNLAQISEIALALRRFRAAGKTVVFSMEQADNMTYLAAAWGADEIYLRPIGSLYIEGFSSTQLYFRDLLERFGIQAVGFESHPAKSANHPFTRSGMSDESRENMERLVSDVFDVYMGMIAEGRGDKLTQDPYELWDRAPYLLAADAEQAGLIDGRLYHYQVEKLLREQYPGVRFESPVHANIRDPRWKQPRLPRIALLYAVGPILSGEGMLGSSIGSETLARQIRNAREDDSIDAILLRVSSGGGSALASDVIAREVYRTTRGDNPKPLVVSMGDVAASGGYYISAYADSIFAYPSTITGSIGVTMASFFLHDLLEEWDINVESIATSDSGYFLNPLQPLDEQHANQATAYVDSVYQRFIEVVADGRDMSAEAVDQVAMGQVWTGESALERGLVDQLGGLRSAIEYALQLAGVDGPADVHVPQVEGVFYLRNMPSAAAALLQPESQLPELQRFLVELREIEAMSRDGAMYLLPYSLRY